MTEIEIYERWKRRKKDKLDVDRRVINTLQETIDKKSHRRRLSKKIRKQVYDATVTLYNKELDKLEGRYK